MFYNRKYSNELKCNEFIFELPDFKNHLINNDGYYISDCKLDRFDETDFFQFIEVLKSGGENYLNYLPNLYKETDEEIFQLLLLWKKLYLEKKIKIFTINVSSSEKAIGYIVLHSPLYLEQTELNGSNWTISCFIHNYFSKRNIMTNAILTLIPILKDLEISNVNILVKEDNLISLKLLSKFPVQLLYREVKNNLLIYDMDILNADV